MKHPSAFALAMLWPLFVGWTSRVPRLADNATSIVLINQAGAVSVTGTKWMGKNGEGQETEYRFNAGGALHYKRKGQLYTNGTWEQTGSVIYMEINDGYAKYRGWITGDEMKGKATNVAGKVWAWEYKKKK
jgi:hypothetical protein